MKEPNAEQLQEGFTVTRALIESIAGIAFKMGVNFARRNPNEGQEGAKYEFFRASVVEIAVGAAREGHMPTNLPLA
jgi:hypothetical protein